MKHRIGRRHRRRLLCLLAILFAFFLVGFAKPRDPRVTAVVVPDLGGTTVEVAAKKHLTRADGVVLYVALAERKMRIETGPEARKVLSDAEALSILDDRMRPLLREGRSDEAVEAGIAAIEQALARGPAGRRAHDDTMAWVVFGFVGVFVVGIFAAAAVSRRKRVVCEDGTVVFVNAPAPVDATTHVDTSSGGGFAGGGGASSSW